MHTCTMYTQQLTAATATDLSLPLPLQSPPISPSHLPPPFPLEPLRQFGSDSHCGQGSISCYYHTLQTHTPPSSPSPSPSQMQQQSTAEASTFQVQHRAALTRYVEAGRLSSEEADACSTLATSYREQQSRGQIGITWEGVAPLNRETRTELPLHPETLSSTEERSLLDEIVVLRLNGGLGTSMGCAGPKALIPVTRGETFLDLVLRQTSSLNTSHGVNIPLVLMNSMRTDPPTRRAIAEGQQRLISEGEQQVDVRYFLQPVYPRLNPTTLFPSVELEDLSEDELWYPPGHATVFPSFVSSGLAKHFLDKGKRWVFVANVDNLGAWPDPQILKVIERKAAETQGKAEAPSFYMEATKKTPIDVKGGAPVLYKGRPFLLEASQVPEGHQGDFEDITRFEFFNTGNLWINLEAWLHFPPLDLPIMPNPKTVVASGHAVKVLQLETGIGTAYDVLPSHTVIVPRTRFVPVKLTSDLLRLRSDVYDINSKTGFIRPMVEPLPEIKLSAEFTKVEDMEKRVRGSISLRDTRRLVLDGNIVLEDGVKFVGDVLVHSHTEHPLELGTVYTDMTIE